MKFNDLVTEFTRAAQQAPRIYFAPLVGAYRAVRAEMTASGSVRGLKQPSVEISAMPAGKRKR